MYYYKSRVRTTCEAKTQSLEFLSWFQSSTAVERLLGTLSRVPSVVTDAAGYPNIIMSCGNTQVYTNPTVYGSFAGPGLMDSLLSQTLAFYTQIDSARQYTFTEASQLEAVQQVVNGEIDVAVVQPDYISYAYATEWQQFVAAGDIVALPASVFNIAPIFHLPVSIVDLDGPFKYTLYGAATTRSCKHGTVLVHRLAS